LGTIKVFLYQDQSSTCLALLNYFLDDDKGIKKGQSFPLPDFNPLFRDNPMMPGIK
jgi:hypothetical protein